jgi:hypothetical protein
MGPIRSLFDAEINSPDQAGVPQLDPAAAAVEEGGQVAFN